MSPKPAQTPLYQQACRSLCTYLLLTRIISQILQSSSYGTRPIYTLPTQWKHTCVRGRERFQLSNLLGVGEGTCELLLWEGICSPFTNTSWTTLGEKRCETVDWVCWLLGARCAGPTRMLLRNSVTPGAWEQHRNSTEENRERTREQEGEGWGRSRRRDERKKEGEREREICYLAFH